MSDGKAILLNLVFMLSGVVLGGLLSWYFSRRYYLKAAADAAADNEKRRQATNAIALKLEQPDISEFTRDADGNLRGVVRTATAHATGSSQAIAVGMATHSPLPQYDRQHEQPPSPETEGDNA